LGVKRGRPRNLRIAEEKGAKCHKKGSLLGIVPGTLKPSKGKRLQSGGRGIGFVCRGCGGGLRGGGEGVLSEVGLDLSG